MVLAGVFHLPAFFFFDYSFPPCAYCRTENCKDGESVERRVLRLHKDSTKQFNGVTPSRQNKM